MAVKSIEYSPTIAADTNRGPSNAIWGGIDTTRWKEQFRQGMVFEDDFLVAGNLTTTNAIGSMGQWATWASTNAVTGTDPAQDGGVILLSDGGNSSVAINLSSVAGSFRMVVAGASSTFTGTSKLAFECRVAVGSITTAKRDCFIGLCDNTSGAAAAANNVINSSTNTLATANNLFGFHFRSTTNPTDVGLAFNVAAGTVQYPTNLQTLSNTVGGAALTAYTAGSSGALATGFIKLGFVYDPFTPYTQTISSASSGQTAGNIARPVIKIFVNGQPAAAFLTTTNTLASTFPVGWMAPVISYESRSASSAGGFYVDWIRVAQAAAS